MSVGTVTRGTTNTNRLRRVDRWLAAQPVLRRAADPLIVDLGYGASAVTTLELHRRLARVRPDVEIVGIEIEPSRVETARDQLEEVRAAGTSFAADARIRFAVGGFEVPLPGGRRVAVIRALNVLRQYPEGEVAAAWQLLLSRLQPGGVLIDGTCNEIGRVASWIDVTADGPQHLTLSLRLADLERPSIVAERLPKALIHRNVEGERVHAFLAELDRQWQFNAALATYGATQRWIASVQAMKDAGWPISGGRRRWRLGEVSVAWAAVAPAG
ncbi:class I SAM-dependent methyltransferase [Microbacterium sp. STN6]|uniref:class I SAM-dependent methyltransferase n=1 Tax=Microbacterium sp. STN6 TaxID=2995588 RepID=UPI00226101BD|nr:class I SAM-dependent methyltransferase [Microbacterium sp. STN6]MCX7523382.1 class I SAM-dependent methyltransferase [Microbacterium sp. STN6]